MNRSQAGSAVIAKAFQTIGGIKAYTTFSRPTREEEECVQLLRSHFDTIIKAKSRDLYLNSLVMCIADYSDEDEDEAITEGSFSQHRFYAAYVHDLIYHPDKFDFLMQCIVQGVCRVRRPEKFHRLISAILARQEGETSAARAIPNAILEYDKLLEEDEEKRVESFTLRKDWVCQVPPLPVLAASLAQGEYALPPPQPRPSVSASQGLD